MTHPAPRPTDTLAADFWDAYAEANPIFATTIGDDRFDDRLPDRGDAARAAIRARYAALLAEAGGPPGPAAARPDPGSTGARPDQGSVASRPDPGRDPDPAAAITRSALRECLAAEIATLDTGLAAWSVDALDGIPVELLSLGDLQPASTPAAGRALLARWRAMPGYTDRYVDALRRSLADGLVACREPVDRVADVVAELLARPDASWPLLVPLEAARASGTWPATELDGFAADVLAVVRDEIRPAFVRLHAALNGEIAPAARPQERAGLSHVRGGDAAYRALIRLHTSLDLEPDTLHRTGLAEIERVDGEMEALCRRVLGSRSRTEAVAALRRDPALHFATGDEVFAMAVSALARANEAIPDWFGRLPRTPCTVVRMGPHEAEHSTIAYYRQPAEDGSRPGQYAINTSHPETRPRYEAAALAYHESVPGHHLQLAIAQELDGLPAFRRNLGPTAFIEGWGLYAERLADDMGLYTDDLDRIGVLSFDAWRASRLVVDTGLHAMGWTRRQAIDYMLAHTALAENNIANEVDRYIVQPGQALAYKTGQMEMLRLRDEARAALGRAFDASAFHDTLLGNGAIALTTLREVVEGWVAGAVARA